MSALKKKVDANISARLKQREIEHNKLLQRYQNVKKELETQQNLERIRLEKTNMRPGTANQSMMGSKMRGSRMSSAKIGRGAEPASKPSNY